MKKTTKGALAAGAAAVLLLGGAGSLAYWTAQGTANAGTISSGSLSLTDSACGTWKYAAGESGAGDAVTAIVPGDVVTDTCTYVIHATGDHIAATVSTPSNLQLTASPGPSATATPTSFQATVDSSYTVTDAASGTPTTITPTTVLTGSDDGATLTATFTVTFPYGDTTTTNDNDMQLSTASLGDLTVTLTQQNPNS